MASVRSLTKPPIREAIIEVKADLSDFGRVTGLRDLLADRFPNAKPFRLASLAFQVPDDSDDVDVDQSAVQQIGWRCESADGAEVVLIRTDGFSVARLADYPGWEKFCERFLELWEEYRQTVAPPEIQRVGLRYINDLRLPLSESFNFDDWLTSTPRPPAGLPPALVDFMVQMTVPTSAEGTTVHVTQATDSGARSETMLPVVIDIDVCTECIHASDDRAGDLLASTLSEMRELKNRVFFGLITENLAATYNGGRMELHA